MMRTDRIQQRMKQFELLCRERGLPLTMQRRAVLEVMLGRKDHPTADQICDDLRRRLPTISRMTVYRILNTLVQTGMITKICHPGSAVRFDPKIHQHHHLVCLRCESIVDIESPRLNEVPWPNVRDLGFEISDYHIHFRGACAKCRRRRQGSSRNRSLSGKAATRNNNSPRRTRGSRKGSRL
jgi:Fur family peroxide stress response transcriptional regulator